MKTKNTYWILVGKVFLERHEQVSTPWKTETNLHYTYLGSYLKENTVRATKVGVEKQKYCIFWVCFCRVRYPACKAHAPYYHLWPVRLHSLFPHSFMNVTIFGGKNVTEHQVRVLSFSTKLSEAFFRRIQPDTTINAHTSSRKVQLLLSHSINT